VSAAICPFCDGDGGEVLWRGARLRVILAAEPDHPAFLRVVWNAHVREMTDLAAAQRVELMDAVWAAEQALRDALRPDKVNLASFGNMVPHLHWHMIARWTGDPHFPNPVWGARLRDGPRALAARDRAALASRLEQAMGGDRASAGA
jgi:diadenosine tetraphosphate (Ap4A) HIT family hydrolase